MFDLQRFASPQQLQALAQIRQVTSQMKARITSKDNLVQVELLADEDEVKGQIPAVREALVQSLAATLHQLFGITGEILE